MKRYIYTLCFMMASMVLYTSCLGSESADNNDYYYSTAIQTFSLATVNRYVHTTSKSGGDSIYKKALSNPVVFTIDQYQRKIYNTDSLPADCDLSHVLATITSRKNGVIVIKSMTSDTLTVYGSSDSIDFSKPREIRVYAYNNSDFRAYEVTINKHQVASNTMVWQKMSAADLPTDAIRAWWEEKLAATELKFIGSGSAEAYAFNGEGQLMVSKDKGETWSADVLDDDPALLPTENFAFVSYPFVANDSTDYQLLVGTCDQVAHSVVWRKICEFAGKSQSSKWCFMPTESSSLYNLPKMEHLNLLYYKGQVLAIGNDGKIYISRDQGITWKTTSAYTLPSNIGTYNLSATTSDGFIWLVGKDTGEVWRGQMID